MSLLRHWSHVLGRINTTDNGLEAPWLDRSVVSLVVDHFLLLSRDLVLSFHGSSESGGIYSLWGQIPYRPTQDLQCLSINSWPAILRHNYTIQLLSRYNQQHLFFISPSPTWAFYDSLVRKKPTTIRHCAAPEHRLSSPNLFRSQRPGFGLPN